MASLKIAISGGGIASLCLAHCLTRQHPQWEVKVFEAAPELREEGAAIGLGSNAQDALKLMSPSLREALDEAGGTRMDPSVRIMIGTGPESGRHVGDIRPKVAQIVVHRTSFWRQLRKRIPDGVLEFGKKLASVRALHGSDALVRLRFEDGSSYDADALVGCDGINSIVRGAILGEDHPAAKPVFTNGYNHRVVIPLSSAKEAFGEEYCSLRTQYGWVGKGGFLLTDHVENGEAMQVIAGRSDSGPWPYHSPFVEWDKARLRSDLADWGDIGKSMTKVFTEQPNLFAAGGRIHLETPTYAKGNMCMAGDAAQSFPPFQGAGAGQAIEDALMLSTVLSSCTSKDDMPRAFDVYDGLRRPRRSSIAQSSIWAAKLFTGRLPEVGLNIERMAERLPSWGSNIYEYDLAAAQQEGVARMKTSSS
ncbi:hypothetical protein DOTSEDRAFT_67616 [Dothistroma septosporum NZE10]|uniref:FAD-binding domain-containing protein n=1 Tax=Dothistroma septosporum (strain NZE10 / CBS 128990) TaxID=675120 RepID=N1PYQ6_DOTSN|nr:hypothetical protein DOTSEDRAFT_67616 [Dothistroma septosporum NZE10]